MPQRTHISEEHYQRGRAIYDAEKTIRDVILACAALDGSPNEDAIPSLIIGFADCFLADVRRAVRR